MDALDLAIPMSWMTDEGTFANNIPDSNLVGIIVNYAAGEWVFADDNVSDLNGDFVFVPDDWSPQDITEFCFD